MDRRTQVIGWRSPSVRISLPSTFRYPELTLLPSILVDNIEYGRGTGSTKTDAADNAAEQALKALMG